MLKSRALLYPSKKMTFRSELRITRRSSGRAKAARRLTLRVCRTWHRTHGVQVPVPGISAAAGEEKGQGVTARWGLEEAQCKEVGRRTGTGDEVWDTRDERARAREVRQARGGVRYKAGVDAAKVRWLTPGGRQGVEVEGLEEIAGHRRESRRQQRKQPSS